MTFITHGFRVSVVSDVRERVRDLASPLRFMLRRSSLVECASVLHGATCLQCAEQNKSISMWSHVKKILGTHFNHKELASLAYYLVCWYTCIFTQGSSWSYGSWIYNYICNQCLPPLRLWVRILLMGRCTRYNIMW